MYFCFSSYWLRVLLQLHGPPPVSLDRAWFWLSANFMTLSVKHIVGLHVLCQDTESEQSEGVEIHMLYESTSAWTMDREGSNRVEITGVKSQVTVWFCQSKQYTNARFGAAILALLTFPSGWHVTHSPKHCRRR